MIYEASLRGDPLAMLHEQLSWHVRPSNGSVLYGIGALACGEPIWCTYVPGCDCYWSGIAPHGTPLFNIAFLNPVVFIGAWVLLLIGWVRRWITVYSLIGGGLLLAIPYVIQTGRQCMLAEARFASVAVPMYAVAGNLLASMKGSVVMYVAAVGPVMLAVYAGLFAHGYPVW